jgi:competence ComEA-like helix-hairpin-helix protein
MAALSIWAGNALFQERAGTRGKAVELTYRPGKERPLVIVTEEGPWLATNARACPDSVRYLLGHKININTAEALDLDLLPGIGAKTAETIVSERDERSGFKSQEDLDQVPGLSATARQSLLQWTEVE